MGINTGVKTFFHRMDISLFPMALLKSSEIVLMSLFFFKNSIMNLNDHRYFLFWNDVQIVYIYF